jgi:hypothetical protein
VYRWIGWEGGARWPVWSHLHEVLFQGGSRRVGRGRSQDALSEFVGDGQKVPVEDGR